MHPYSSHLAPRKEGHKQASRPVTYELGRKLQRLENLAVEVAGLAEAVDEKEDPTTPEEPTHD